MLWNGEIFYLHLLGYQPSVVLLDAQQHPRMMTGNLEGEVGVSVIKDILPHAGRRIGNHTRQPLKIAIQDQVPQRWQSNLVGANQRYSCLLQVDRHPKGHLDLRLAERLAVIGIPIHRTWIPGTDRRITDPPRGIRQAGLCQMIQAGRLVRDHRLRCSFRIVALTLSSIKLADHPILINDAT